MISLDAKSSSPFYRVLPRQIKRNDLGLLTPTVRHNVAEVLGADAGPDGGPGVGLGPDQLTAGGRADWVAGVAQLYRGGETFPARIIVSSSGDIIVVYLQYLQRLTHDFDVPESDISSHRNVNYCLLKVGWCSS